MCVLCCRDVVGGASTSSDWLTCENVDTSSDLLLAQMLQFELDAEHDLQLQREEDKWNGSSKGLHSSFLSFFVSTFLLTYLLTWFTAYLFLFFILLS